MIYLIDAILFDQLKQFVALHNVELFEWPFLQNPNRIFYVRGDYVFHSIDIPKALGQFGTQLPACAYQ